MLGYLLAVAAIWGAANGKAEITLTILALSTVLLLLHELGHAFVARRFGLHVEDIVLWPLGGMARIREMPESPRVEAWVAAAGPAVNLALALAALPVTLLATSEPTGELSIAGLQIPMPRARASRPLPDQPRVRALQPRARIPDGRRPLLRLPRPRWPDWYGRPVKRRVGGIIAPGRSSPPRSAGLPSASWALRPWAGLQWIVRLRRDPARARTGRFAGWGTWYERAQAGGFGGFGGNTASPFGGGPTVDVDAQDPVSPEDLPRVGGGFSEDDVAELESFRGRLRKPPGQEE